MDAAPTEEPELKIIDIGDNIPSITIKNEKDEDIDTANLAVEKGVVLFLIPKADTRTCPSSSSSKLQSL